MYAVNDYDYHLPRALIAQQPVSGRDRSRLFVLNRRSGEQTHHIFQDLTDLLRPSDVLVVNNTKVVPARLCGRKPTGGKVDLLLLDYAGNRRQDTGASDRIRRCLIKASKRPLPGTRLLFDGGLSAEVLEYKDGIFTVHFQSDRPLENLLYEIGHVPLPPYIQRDETVFDDTTAYQTVYASQKGAVAAPTAGLHFSKTILGNLKKKGIQIVEITLHVGYGTFLPVRVADIRRHRMHPEWFAISETAAETISDAKADGRRIVAVGTTAVRTLEFVADATGHIEKKTGDCDLFIYPGHHFRMVDAMLTNFHLPKSTLLMLVAAFAGRERVLDAYRTAISEGYRFYSYGDAMLIV